MPKVEIPPAISAFIRERIVNFERTARPEDVDEIDNVKKHGGLPLFRGWTETLAIRPDGTLIKWPTEEWPGAKEFGDPVWAKIALTQGAQIYPELRALIPARPASAVTCEQCQGSGDPFTHNQSLRGKIICSCGGVGWLEEGQER
jgi:hypothetical protein